MSEIHKPLTGPYREGATVSPNGKPGPLDALRDRLKSLQAATYEMGAEDAEELKLRDDIEKEEARAREAQERARKLANARLLEACRRKAGSMVDASLVELVDLDSAGVYILKPPPMLAVEAMQKAIAADGSATGEAQIALVIAALLHPDPQTKGPDIRRAFDDFALAPASLCNVAMRLAGMKVDARQKK